MAANVKGKKKRINKNIDKGQVHIKSSFNNTMVTFTDAEGNALSWASSGKLGFKGSKKSTPYAAQQCVEEAAKAAKDFGIKSVDVFVKGPGNGRESAIRSLQNCEINVTSIKDVSPIAHNGCRPPKVRRI
ncbi:MAG: 30S ribosomal protein S11 [Clostridia bacterium]|nr:30S ribosomal protein S11 [Clostridia bacterium]